MLLRFVSLFMVLLSCELSFGFSLNGETVKLATVPENVTIGSHSFTISSVNTNVALVVKFTSDLGMNDAVEVTWAWNGVDKPKVENATAKDVDKTTDYFEDSKDSNERVFKYTVPKPSLSVIGVLTLTVKRTDNDETQQANATIESMPLFPPFAKTKRSLEGDKLTIKCEVKSQPAVESVVWTREDSTNKTLPFGDRMKLSSNVVGNDTLEITNLLFTDAGFILCHATNSEGSNLMYVDVRVKDRLAALWPFLGIVAEVLILVAVILLYEKRRSRQYKASAAQKDEKEALKDGNNQHAAHNDNQEEDDTTRQRAPVKA